MEAKISAEEVEIQRERDGLAGKGPIQRKEIERDIEQREDIIQGWIHEIRASEEGA